MKGQIFVIFQGPLWTSQSQFSLLTRLIKLWPWSNFRTLNPQGYVNSLHFNLFALAQVQTPPHVSNHKPTFPALTFLLAQYLTKIGKFQKHPPTSSFQHPSFYFSQPPVPVVSAFNSFGLPSLPWDIYGLVFERLPVIVPPSSYCNIPLKEIFHINIQIAYFSLTVMMPWLWWSVDHPSYTAFFTQVLIPSYQILCPFLAEETRIYSGES